MAKKKTSQVKTEENGQAVAVSEAKSPAAFFDAIAKLLDAWNSYDEDHAGFWAAVDQANVTQPSQPLDVAERFEVHGAFIKFAGELEAYDNRPNPETEPHAKFWQSLDALHVAFTKPTREPGRPESIAALTKQNVSPTQICAIWGFVDEHGRPQIDRLEQEQATPGSVIFEGFEWPTLRKFRENRVQQYAGYLSSILEKHGAAKSNRQPCNESPEELYRQAVGADQAARMLCIETEEAAKLWAKLEAKLGKPEQSVPVTDARGEPLPEYVPTTRIDEVVDEPTPRASSTYGDLEEAELRELCLASELSDEGDRDELIARLEKQDSEGVPA